MKNILLLVTLMGINCLSAQMSNTESYKDDFDMVQKILYKKPIHIHIENDGFYFCWHGRKTKYSITKNGKTIVSGRTKKEMFISTKYWDNGTYTLEIKNNIEFIVIMRNK